MSDSARAQEVVLLAELGPALAALGRAMEPVAAGGNGDSTATAVLVPAASAEGGRSRAAAGPCSRVWLKHALEWGREGIRSPGGLVRCCWKS